MNAIDITFALTCRCADRVRRDFESGKHLQVILNGRRNQMMIEYH